MRKQLSFTERHSIVWVEHGRVYKSQPKYNTDNEYHFLKLLESSGFVPQNVRQDSIELISMEYIPPQEVTDPDKFHSYYENLLRALAYNAIRHGDLTEYSILVKDNTPIMIDFSESRWLSDSIPSKRPDSDRELLYHAMERVCPL